MSNMTNVGHDQPSQLDSLVTEYSERGMSRRAFLGRAAALGLSFSAAGALLDACGSSSGSSVIKSSTIDLLNVWTGEEATSFKAVVAPFTQSTGITVNLDTTRDLSHCAHLAHPGNNPPDIAILPNPGKMQQLASQGNLIALDNFLDMNTIQSDYAKALDRSRLLQRQALRDLLQGGQQGHHLVQSRAVLRPTATRFPRPGTI